jgi:exodeoxyribonuclease VII small subunit
MSKGKSRAPAPPADLETLDFEQALQSLEQLVGTLEAGEMPLEQALASFERGVALTRRCQAVLKEAEHKVEILTRNAGDEDAIQPFEPTQ